MNRNNKTFIAVFASVILALISAAAVYAFGDPSGNSNHSGANGSDQQSTSGQPDNHDANRSQTGNNSSSSTNNSTTTSISVNGQKVDVPQNGSYDTTKDGVRISGHNSQSSSSSGGSVSNNSSTSVNIQSQ